MLGRQLLFDVSVSAAFVLYVSVLLVVESRLDSPLYLLFVCRFVSCRALSAFAVSLLCLFLVGLCQLLLSVCCICF